MLALTLEAIFENTRREKCAVLGRFWYIAVRPAPTRHVTSRQGCSCAGGGRQTRCGVLPITSCEFTQEEKRKQRGNDLMMPCSPRHSFRSFPQGVVREKQGLIVGPLPRFLSRPESLLRRQLVLLPVSPSVPSNVRTFSHSLTHSHRHTPPEPRHSAVTVREK